MGAWLATRRCEWRPMTTINKLRCVSVPVGALGAGGALGAWGVKAEVVGAWGAREREHTFSRVSANRVGPSKMAPSSSLNRTWYRYVKPRNGSDYVAIP